MGTTTRRLLLGSGAIAVAVSTATVGQGVASAADTAGTVDRIETAPGFTPPIGSDKGSVTGPSAPPRAPALLGEEPIYYPGS